MESTPERPDGSNELKALLGHIMNGEPINQPRIGGFSIQWYLDFLGKHNSIVSIAPDKDQHGCITFKELYRPRGWFHLSMELPGPVIQFNTRYIFDPARLRNGPVNGGDTRLATDDEVRSDIEAFLQVYIHKVTKLDEFITTSLHMRVDDPDHPLCRPVRTMLMADPFELSLPDITGKVLCQLDNYTGAVLLNRQFAGLELLYSLMERIMVRIFVIGQTPDRGASLSNRGIDIFTANKQFIADFLFFHPVYMKNNIHLIKRATVKNHVDWEQFVFQRDLAGVVDILSSIGI